jgi:Fe-S-cluster containining protein
MKSAQPICHRCGTCCQKNSPALHLQDLYLITDRHVAKNQLITYRKGEWVNDNVTSTLIKLDQEIIKPVMNDHCIFYLPENHACAIYNNRPIECQIQLCSDPEPFKRMYNNNRLTRNDVFSPDSPLLELIEYHERHCPLTDLPQSSDKLTKTIQDQLKQMIQFEYHFRYTLYQQTGMQQSDMFFLLGRPIETLLRQSGISG